MGRKEWKMMPLNWAALSADAAPPGLPPPESPESSNIRFNQGPCIQATVTSLNFTEREISNMNFGSSTVKIGWCNACSASTWVGNQTCSASVTQVDALHHPVLPKLPPRFAELTTTDHGRKQSRVWSLYLNSSGAIAADQMLMPRRHS